MNVYFINPTYVKPEGWKPLLTYLKVKAAYSFIPKEELPDSLYSIIKPYLKASYSGQDIKKYSDSCAYWLRAHFEKHIRLILDDYDNVDDIPKEDRIKYSSQSALNNLIYLDESNCLILLDLKSGFDEKGIIKAPKFYVGGLQDSNLPTHITRYCLNILHKKHGHNQYHNQSAFIAFDEFFAKAFMFDKKYREWESYQLSFTSGRRANFMISVNQGVKKLAPNDFPPIEEDGHRRFTPLITEEGDVKLKNLIKDAEEAEKEYEEEQRKYNYDDGKSWQDEVDELNSAFWRECGEGGSNCESWPGWD